MHVRNFWIAADVDGRDTALSGGPRATDGGMDVTILQRADGNITTAVNIICRARPDGSLVTKVIIDNVEVATKVTKR